MEFNDVELRRIKNLIGCLCRNRILDRHGVPLRILYETRGYEVKIFACRQPIAGRGEWTKRPAARLRFDPQKVEWDLYWAAPGHWQKRPNRHAKDIGFIVNEMRRAITENQFQPHF